MKIVNTNDVPEEAWTSPNGKFSNASREISIALGRQPSSTDLLERHPFDVEICRIPAGKTHCPYHSHSAQWEFYHVISGTGQLRHRDGISVIKTGDAFLCKPGEDHQLINNRADDLILYVIADNPIGESCYYPDSKKWLVRSPDRTIIRSEPLDYHDGEE